MPIRITFPFAVLATFRDQHGTPCQRQVDYVDVEPGEDLPLPTVDVKADNVSPRDRAIMADAALDAILPIYVRTLIKVEYVETRPVGHNLAGWPFDGVDPTVAVPSDYNAPKGRK